MKKSIKNNVIIIGAAGGLGDSLVNVCLEHGDAVYAVVKTSVKYADSKQEYMTRLANSSRLHVSECDISDYKASSNVVKNIFNIAETVNYVYICTGIKLTESNNDYWGDIKKTVDINFLSIINCIQSIVELSDNKKIVKIVVVSSMGDKHGMIGTHGYNSSKGALSILCESLQYDFWLNKNNICLQVVRPGFIRTKMNNNSLFANFMSVTCEKAAKKVFRLSRSPKFYNSFPFAMNIFTMLLSFLPIKIRYFVLMRLNNDR